MLNIDIIHKKGLKAADDLNITRASRPIGKKNIPTKMAMNMRPEQLVGYKKASIT